MFKIPDCLNFFSFQFQRNSKENSIPPSEDSITTRTQKVYDWFTECPKRLLPVVVLGGVLVGTVATTLYYNRQIEVLSDTAGVLYNQRHSLSMERQNLINLRSYGNYLPIAFGIRLVPQVYLMLRNSPPVSWR